MTPFVSIDRGLGPCDVCGLHNLLTVRDLSSGLLVGECCYGALKQAHHNLARCGRDGLRHPEPGEFHSRDNH